MDHLIWEDSDKEDSTDSESVPAARFVKTISNCIDVPEFSGAPWEEECFSDNIIHQH